jgi:hypothetical protein
MSSSVTRYPNRHRSEPVRGAVALWCQTLVYCSPLQREFQRIHFDMACLDNVMVRQVGLIVMSNGRVRIQIPIDRQQQ